jgi:hypothetical protein
MPEHKLGRGQSGIKARFRRRKILREAEPARRAPTRDNAMEIERSIAILTCCALTRHEKRVG